MTIIMMLAIYTSLTSFVLEKSLDFLTAATAMLQLHAAMGEVLFAHLVRVYIRK